MHRPSSFLSYASRASTCQHLEGVHRLRLISTCLLKPSIPFWRRACESEVARCSAVSSEEIRFSNPSLTRRRHFAICCLSLCKADGKDIRANGRVFYRMEVSFQSQKCGFAKGSHRHARAHTHDATFEIVRSRTDTANSSRFFIPTWSSGRRALPAARTGRERSESFNRATHPVTPVKRFLSCQSSVATCSSRVSARWRVYCTSG